MVRYHVREIYTILDKYECNWIKPIVKRENHHSEEGPVKLVYIRSTSTFQKIDCDLIQKILKREVKHQRFFDSHKNL